MHLTLRLPDTSGESSRVRLVSPFSAAHPRVVYRHACFPQINQCVHLCGNIIPHIGLLKALAPTKPTDRRRSSPGVVEDKNIAPHVPVWDKSERTDGTFSRSDFIFDAGSNTYACSGGNSVISASASAPASAHSRFEPGDRLATLSRDAAAAARSSCTMNG
jgi:hypothetical protein